MSQQPQNPSQSKSLPPEQPDQKEEDVFEYYEPTKQEYQFKIFINNCNGYLGSQLVEAFRNDHQIEVNPNLIVGTMDSNAVTQGQTEVSSVVDIKEKRMLNSVLRKADIIVYTLNQETANDFEYIVKVLRKMQFQGEKKKKVICISSLLTWNSQRGLNSKINVENLDKRNSTQSYLMELENLCLDLNNLKNNIDSYVICAGIVYGNGQGELFSYFKRALEQTEKLKVYGTGSNHIPMIHVEDLSQMAQELGFKGIVGDGNGKKLPRSNYYFGVDHSVVNQEEIIKTISETVGNGQYQAIPLQDTFLQKNFQDFTLDMEIQNLPALSSWHSKEGFIAHIGQVVSEFNLYRGLKPNKIIVTGPPASGRTKIAQILQNSYGLPVLNIKKLVDEVKEEQSEYAENMKIKLEELRTQRIEEERKAFEEAKKKKKGKGGDEFDPDKVMPRLPDEDVIQLFKRRLNKSDCLNKGYILDGWPKSSKQCEGIFLDQNKEINEVLLPNSVFMIQANEEEVKERIKGIPAETKEGTHWNEEATVRRFQTYTKYNEEEGNISSFFDGKVDLKKVQFAYEGTKQFVEFVERNGPLGFKKKQVEKEKVEEAEVKEEEKEEKKEVQENEENQQQNEEEEEEKIEESDEQFNLQKLTEHEKTILNEKSRPIRQYLIDNVIPQITEGLLEICKDAPRDPIDFLIKFLESRQRVKKAKKSH